MPDHRIYPPTSVNYTLAAKYLRQGKLVSFPTETVYGLGANACDDRAVAEIFAAKDRPRFNPLIVHVPSLEMAEKYAYLDFTSRQLAEKFWPGPFTLVLNKKPDGELSDLVSAGLDTVAIRLPRHSVAQQLLRQFGGPIAAPSANRSGRVSPTTAKHVEEELDDRVAMILDGGPCDEGIESTIVQVSGQEVRLLRPGSVSPREIEMVAGLPVKAVTAADTPTAPGQLKSHYAPRAKLRLNATHVLPDEALLAFGRNIPHTAGPDTAGAVRNLSPSGSLKEAAANLFAMLRELDSMNVETIAVSPIPSQGLGLAINDRLQRAAAPRPENTPAGDKAS
ncbi:L-threonylcarbamoyladenylate synthase [Luteithermobacter gelatinilyticus]|uniref:L-threonylcarbamoyladenylate synthase n=1 Tax=Luteithermobacter gelatinilyticus TaxID=2582913 RepID=UPI0011073295|nr:L-threonylcarbamoyladenylate synthase [Luteithermobacter gelatinilyticus]